MKIIAFDHQDPKLLIRESICNVIQFAKYITMSAPFLTVWRGISEGSMDALLRTAINPVLPY